MALLFMDGFDAGDLTLKWDGVASGVTTQAATRFGTGRQVIFNTTSGGNKLSKSIPPRSTIFAGFAYNTQALGQYFIAVYGDSGSVNHITLAHDVTGRIEIRRGSTAIALSTDPCLSVNSWAYIEMHIVVDDASGYVEVRCNGNTVVTYSGDTKNGGTSSNIDYFAFVWNSSADYFVDDFYLCDDTGSAPYNDFLGDVRIHTLTPNAAGASTQFTPSAGANYETVDELPWSDTDYIYGTTGQKDTYGATDLPGGVGLIYGVQTNAIVKKTDAGGISGRAVVRAGGTDYPGASISVGTSDTFINKVDQVNPATSTAWTSGDVNGMEIGVESL